MNVETTANRLVELCREGNFRFAVEELYSEDIVSVEPQGDPREVQGMEAIRGKLQWFDTTFDITEIAVDGPWINEPCFLVRFTIQCTLKSNGDPCPMDEYALYTCQDGKIVHERFF